MSKELTNLHRYFCQNGYPVNLIEKHIGTMLNQLYSTPIKSNTSPNQETYVKIPFMHESAYETSDSSLWNLVGKF